ncbi:MAG TPA: N-formylglutamate amidohydrolase [Magnetospirillaceae bacterium]|nr:N-formylglutamate amidohydrolase [Magnetospirillaceae bacterium]
MRKSLLSADEPRAVAESRRDGRSDFVILVDHASRRIPKSLQALGLPESELVRHIAWDIGALGVAQRVAEALDATLVAQNYSRLVIDCNRPASAPTAIPPISEITAIPGNEAIDEAEREARRIAIHAPYHDHIAAVLDERARQGRKTILIAQHTMTPVFKGSRRDMQAAVLYNRDGRFAVALRDTLSDGIGSAVADNQPYAMTDDSDFTLPVHGEKRGLPHVGIEIRQDLVEDEAGQLLWADRVATALEIARRAF